MKKVFISGFGTINPLGLNTETTWENICNGKSGIDFIELFETKEFTTKIAGEVKNFNPADHINKKSAQRMDRFAQFAVIAALEALQHSKIDLKQFDSYRIAVIVGSGIGGLSTLSQQHEILEKKGPSRVTPFLIPMMLSDMASAQISMLTKARGQNFCPVSSCSSGADAIGIGMKMIRNNEVDIAIVGGAEAPVCPITIAGFNSARALSKNNDNPQKASRPFHINRDGFVISEGAGILILENELALSKGNRSPIVELIGYGTTSDAYHITEPGPEGISAANAMKKALLSSNISANEIDYINAHGTSTSMNDKLETQAIKNILGELSKKIPVSSTKSMTGHLLGAGGALEAIICSLSIKNGILPPTINLDEIDPNCDLRHIYPKAEKLDIKIALSNSFGFGGHNSVLAFKAI